MKGLDRGEEPSEQQSVERAAVKPVVFEVVDARELAPEIAETTSKASDEQQTLPSEARAGADRSVEDWEHEDCEHQDVADFDCLDEPFDDSIAYMRAPEDASPHLPPDGSQPPHAASEWASPLLASLLPPSLSDRARDGNAQEAAFETEVDRLRGRLEQSEQERGRAIAGLAEALDRNQPLLDELEETRDQLAIARDEIGRMRCEASERRGELDKQRQEITALGSEVERLTSEGQLAQEALQATEARMATNATELARQIRARYSDVAELTEEFELELSELNAELEAETQRVVDVLMRVPGSPSELDPDELDDVHEALALGDIGNVSEALDAFNLYSQEQDADRLVVIPRSATTKVGLLDHDPLAVAYGRKTLRALLALYAYARAKEQGTRGIGSNFWDWCVHSSNPFKWQANEMKLAMRESESTMNDPRLAETRNFRIDERVSGSATKAMPAHMKISTRGLSPRLHFFDDTRGKTKQVHVGYIGPHLPTSQFK